MNPASHHINSVLAQYPKRPIIVAFSGGADSQALLELICDVAKTHGRLGQVVVCHVHHGLSDNADGWFTFAQKESERRNIHFHGEKVLLAIDNGDSIEALARTARYQILASLSSHPALIFTGHHQDDQVETLLLALKRGSGVKGLGAIALTSKHQQHLLCRPLLNNTRADIEAFVQSRKLEWVSDESNFEDRYDRNFLRNQVLPLLNERWPSFNQAAARTSELCRQNQQLVDELAASDLKAVKGEQQGLNINGLLALSTARFSNLVRYYLATINAMMPSKAQLDELSSQLDVQEDKVPAVKLGELWARRYQGQLYFTPEFADVSDFTISVELDELNAHSSQPQIINLPDSLGTLVIEQLDKHVNEHPVSGDKDSTLYFSLPADSNSLMVSCSHDNPKVLPDFRQHSRSLKKVLKELNLPPWKRKRVPFIYCQSQHQQPVEQQLVAAAGHFVCQPFLPAKQVLQFVVSWRAAKESS